MSAHNNRENSKDLLELSAPCPAGFETALAKELKTLGCSRVRPLTGSVSFAGDIACALRVCLWSRFASRITLVLKRVDAFDSDELYEGVRRIHWEDQIAPLSTIAVRVRGGNDALHDERYVAMRIKDAVCDRLREETGSRPDVDAKHPDLLITCHIHGDRATVGIDLSGSSLTDRGYRVAQHQHSARAHSAYLREDLAALILEEVDWPKRSARDTRGVFVDPLGTSPTLAIEAACIACDRAPGLVRSHWGFIGWLGFDADIWDKLLAQADERFEQGLKQGRRVVMASPDAGVCAEARAMAKRAGVASAVEIVQGNPCDIDLGEASIPSSAMACVVPQEGVFSRTSAQPLLLSQIASLARTPALAEAPLAVLSSEDVLGYALMCKPERVTHVMDGIYPAVIEVYPSQARVARIAQQSGNGSGAAPQIQENGGVVAPRMPAKVTLPDGREIGVYRPESEQFAARLRKMARHRGKWARRTGVSCYRVYDADVPEFAVAIDLYEGAAATPGRWAVVSEYAAPREIDPHVASRRLADVIALVGPELDIDPENVFLKVRQRDRGGSQYANAASRQRGRREDSRRALVEEGGLVFEVNFSDYLDTGLFLDNRLVREHVRQDAEDARFLNLFAYTGTASCYAADGGAYSTTTVDLSATYLDWAQRNMEQNGFSGPEHEFVQADVVQWVEEQRHTANRWDLIFVDPPTFSNSARMRVRGFDVQRDHAELLIGCSRLLSREGTIIFSCNLRGFKPDVETLARAGVSMEDITADTIPEDFSRNARIHHCYLVRRVMR